MCDAITYPYHDYSRSLVKPSMKNSMDMYCIVQKTSGVNNYRYPNITPISKVSCHKGPTRHTHSWKIGPFWQDTLDLSVALLSFHHHAISCRGIDYAGWMILQSSRQSVLIEGMGSSPLFVFCLDYPCIFILKLFDIKSYYISSTWYDICFIWFIFLNAMLCRLLIFACPDEMEK